MAEGESGTGRHFTQTRTKDRRKRVEGPDRTEEKEAPNADPGRHCCFCSAREEKKGGATGDSHSF